MIEEFYRDKFDTLVMQLSRKAGSPENAEDIVHDAFEKAIRYRDAYNPNIQKFETWFYSILKRCLFDFKRIELRQGMTILAEEPLYDELAVKDGFEKRLAGEIEQEIYAKDNVSHKNILYLYFVKEYAPRDIAQISEENVKNIYQIVKRFKSEIQDYYGDLGWQTEE